MGKPLKFDPDANKPHKVSVVVCLRCRHRWVAVRPAENDLLVEIVCPACRLPGDVIETGQDLDAKYPDA